MGSNKTPVVEGVFPEDGADADMSTISSQDIIRDVISTANKRRAEDQLENENQRTPAFQSALLKQINSIDKQKTLSIHTYLQQQQHDDPPIRDFVQRLVKLGFFPRIPSSDDVFNLSTYSRSSLEEVSKTCHSVVVETLMSYFQINYFKSNMMDATSARATVIPVKAKISMPCFQLVPDSDLRTTTKLKQNLAILLQKQAYSSSQFISELLLLKSASFLHDELANVVKKTELKSRVQFHFEIHYHKARMEFIREFNIKNIDWENFESKVIHTQPYWRQRELPMPEAVINRYASKIKHRIQTSNELFDPESVTAEFQQFLMDGEVAVEEIKRKKLSVKNMDKTGENNSIFSPPKNPTVESDHPNAHSSTQHKFQFSAINNSSTQRSSHHPRKGSSNIPHKQKKGPPKNGSSFRRPQHNNENKLHHYQRPSKKPRTTVEKPQHEDFNSILTKTK